MTIPSLTPRAAREQRTFRTLLNAMAHPASVERLELDGANPLVTLAEALVDHEVTFAVAPENADLTEAILRQTGSHVVTLPAAQYVFCEAEALERVLREATDGTWEYPDAGATVVCRVPAISEPGPVEEKTGSRSPRKGKELGGEETLLASGPGVRDTASVIVEGFSPGARRVFVDRNAARPLGLDLVLVTGEGVLVCFTRYTQLEEE